MKTDLFTVHPEDLVDLAASMMEWEHVRHVPVEDDDGQLVGLVSHRALLRLVGRGKAREGTQPVAVREIMAADPVTTTPQSSSLEAMRTMRRNKVGCLPVVSEGRLVGIVTERDFIHVAAKLLEESLEQE
jgi:CBS domain-containing protein